MLDTNIIDSIKRCVLFSYECIFTLHLQAKFYCLVCKKSKQDERRTYVLIQQTHMFQRVWDGLSKMELPNLFSAVGQSDIFEARYDGLTSTLAWSNVSWCFLMKKKLHLLISLSTLGTGSVKFWVTLHISYIAEHFFNQFFSILLVTNLKIIEMLELVEDRNRTLYTWNELNQNNQEIE